MNIFSKFESELAVRPDDIDLYQHVHSTRYLDYVLAARSMGARPWRIIRHHLLPNTIAPAIVLAARDVGGVVCWPAPLSSSALAATWPGGRCWSAAVTSSSA